MNKLIAAVLAGLLVFSGSSLPPAFAVPQRNWNDLSEKVPSVPVRKAAESVSRIPSVSSALTPEKDEVLTPVPPTQLPRITVRVGDVVSVKELRAGLASSLWVNQQTEYAPDTLVQLIEEKENSKKTVVSQRDPARGLVHQDIYEWVDGYRSILRLVSSTAHGGRIPTAVPVPGVPVVRFGSAEVTHQSQYTLAYSVNGVTRYESRQLTEGDNALEVKVTNSAGQEFVHGFHVTLDTQAPSGSLSINSGAESTDDINVVVNLTVQDTTSGVDRMRFSVDRGLTWSVWETYRDTKTLQLYPKGSVSQEIWLEVIDRAGNMSAVISDAILFVPQTEILPAKAVESREGVRKVLMLGPTNGADGQPITYVFTASENLMKNVNFTLNRNQLTYEPKAGFTGLGFIEIAYWDGAKVIRQQVTLNIKPVFSLPLNDHDYSQQYGLSLTRGQRAWGLSQGSGSVVAVIDTGVSFDQPDLAGNIYTNPGEIAGDGIDNDGNGYVDDVHGWDFYDQDNLAQDGNGHGTNVSSIIAAGADNLHGIAGISPQATVLPLKVFDDQGDFTQGIEHFINGILKAIRYAIALGIRIISISLGLFVSDLGPEILKEAETVFEEARKAGVLIFAAAGNNAGLTKDIWPNNMTGIFSMAATNSKDERAISIRRKKFSNYGPGIFVSAPGELIVTDGLRQGDTDFATGTSFSAPLVAGIAALILSQNPDATPEDVERRLKFSAVDLGESGWDPYFGWGRVDAFRALSYDYYDNGIIKTQYLEKPDENGWNRLNFDSTGYLIGGSLVRLSGASAGLAGLAAEAVVNVLGIMNPAKDILPETYWIDRDEMAEDEVAVRSDEVLVAKSVFSALNQKSLRKTVQNRKASSVAIKALMEGASVNAKTSADDVSLKADFYGMGLAPMANLGRRLHLEF